MPAPSPHTVVASQALITGVFSIIRQAINLDVFPPLEVRHTDKNVEGQIYLPKVWPARFFYVFG